MSEGRPNGVEENLDLSPIDATGEKVVKETALLIVSIGATLASPIGPILVEIFKSVANVLGFSGQRRKAERARDFSVAIYERLQATRSEYVHKEEFQDLFEDALRRTAEQPDPKRRADMRSIFLRIIEEPREHVKNRQLLRFADELPSECLEILAVLDRDLTEEERELRIGSYALAQRLAHQPSEIRWPLKYLVNENLIDEDTFNTAPGFGAAGENLLFLLTPLGRTFVDYIRTLSR